MKVVIIDNEVAIREMLVMMLELYCPEVTAVAQAACAAEAQELLKNFHADLLLLDVELQEGTGFDLLRQIPQRHFQVIFITAHNKYAIDAFRYSAIDYLLKPIEPELLIQSIQKVAKNVHQQDLQGQLERLLARMQSNSNASPRITLRDAERIYYLRPSEISYCEADGGYTRFYLEDGPCITVSKHLKEFTHLLEPMGFLRTHNSYLVNREKVLRYEKSTECLVLDKHQSVPLSHRKRESILRLLEQPF